MSKAVKAKKEIIKPNKFSKSDIVSEVITKYPGAVEVLLSFGLNCVGCSLSTADSIEVGARSHGMGDDQIKDIMKALNEGAAKYAKEMMCVNGIFMSPMAEKAILNVASEEKKNGQPLRVEVQGDCCQDRQYLLDFDKQKADDVIYEFPKVKIIASPINAEKFKGSTIDFLDGPMGTGFKIDNPKANSCKCNGH